MFTLLNLCLYVINLVTVGRLFSVPPVFDIQNSALCLHSTCTGFSIPQPREPTTCPYREPNQSSVRFPNQFLWDPLQYYLPIDTYFFQAVASVFRVKILCPSIIIIIIIIVIIIKLGLLILILLLAFQSLVELSLFQTLFHCSRCR